MRGCYTLMHLHKTCNALNNVALKKSGVSLNTVYGLVMSVGRHRVSDKEKTKMIQLNKMNNQRSIQKKIQLGRLFEMTAFLTAFNGRERRFLYEKSC